MLILAQCALTIIWVHQQSSILQWHLWRTWLSRRPTPLMEGVQLNPENICLLRFVSLQIASSKSDEVSIHIGTQELRTLRQGDRHLEERIEGKQYHIYWHSLTVATMTTYGLPQQGCKTKSFRLKLPTATLQIIADNGTACTIIIVVSTRYSCIQQVWRTQLPFLWFSLRPLVGVQSTL